MILVGRNINHHLARKRKKNGKGKARKRETKNIPTMVEKEAEKLIAEKR